MFFALSLLASALATETTLLIGQALSVSVPSGVDICPFKVDVTPARAGPKCQIRLRSVFTGIHVAGGNEVEFYFKMGAGAFNASDLKPTVDKVEAEVPCAAAGTYYIGVKVVKCPLCSLIAPATFELGAVYKIDNSYRFDIPDATAKARYAWTRTGAATWWYVDFITTVSGTPHFNIDKEAASMPDNYEYFYAAAGTDFLSTSATKTALSVSAQNVAKIDSLPAGNWTFAVQIKSVSVGDFTTFRFDYSWNADTPSELGTASCPKAICATLENCVDCANKNCNWCENDRKCVAAATCSNGTAVVESKDACFDIDGACKALKDCGACADKDGCVWCNSLSGVGIDVGSCSAGSNNAGAKCTSPTATAITDRVKCSSSSIALTLAAIVASVVALAF